MNDVQKDILYKLIGNKISNYLSEVKNIKQVELLKMLDIKSRATLSNILSGKRQISLHLLVEISQKLNIEPSALFPTLTEISSKFSENNNAINKLLNDNDISDSDREAIFKIINSNNSQKDD